MASIKLNHGEKAWVLSRATVITDQKNPPLWVRLAWWLHRHG